MAVKTGTTNDTRDLATYGYLPRPADSKQPAIAVGVWMGNSDHSYPRARGDPPISLTGPAPLWHAFVRDLTNDAPVSDFKPPKGVVQATIDAWSGGAPGPWTRQTVREWFIAGTQPGAPRSVDEPGMLYDNSCGFWTVDPLQAEVGPSTWRPAVADWMARAQRGPGVTGDLGSTTAYFWSRTGWGGTIGTCSGAIGLASTATRRQATRSIGRPESVAGCVRPARRQPRPGPDRLARPGGGQAPPPTRRPKPPKPHHGKGG